MFQARTHVFRPTRDPELRKRIRENPGITLSSVGDQLPVFDYWPAPWQREGVGRYLPGEGAFGVNHGGTGEWEGLYNGIIANPLDSAPRGMLADWIEERSSDYPLIISQLRGFTGGYQYLPGLRDLVRWKGPGRIGKSLGGTWDVWVGASGQFMQACREGLFIDCPISTVIPADLWPVECRFVHGRPQVVSHVWGDMSGNLGVFLNLNAPGYEGNLANDPTALINDVIACFMPKEAIYPFDEFFGVYTPNNRKAAILAVSHAFVNCGRYAVGLEPLPWDVEVWPAEGAQYLTDLETMWQLARERILWTDDGTGGGLPDPRHYPPICHQYGRKEMAKLCQPLN